MALKFKGNINALYSSKIALVRHLLQFGFPKNKIQPLLDFIKLYINFDEGLNIEFDKRLESLTTKKKKTMGIREQILDITKKQGLEIGLKEGETKAKTNIAKKMKLEGLSQALIAKLTGLSARQIRIL